MRGSREGELPSILTKYFKSSMNWPKISKISQKPQKPIPTLYWGQAPQNSPRPFQMLEAPLSDAGPIFSQGTGIMGTKCPHHACKAYVKRNKKVNIPYEASTIVYQQSDQNLSQPSTKKQHHLSYAVGKLEISGIWLGGDNKREILDKFGNLTLCAPWYNILCDLYIWITYLTKQTEDSSAASLFAF